MRAELTITFVVTVERPDNVAADRLAEEIQHVLTRYDSGRHSFSSEQIQVGLTNAVESAMYNTAWNAAADTAHAVAGGHDLEAYKVATPAAELAASAATPRVDIDALQVKIAYD